jgi:hypothetical protein
MKGEYISVYQVDYQGGALVTQLWVNHNQSYKGLPMDGALVDAWTLAIAKTPSD